ncbi:uncharacterized protein LOC131288031 [Anopheles ziemanni]|uniref:uncharacterized protein LOC131263139 n=1 Tax=Anopheles coustani TaxID=139045 RepID=UPI002659915C|nr:uncharacterized protein LOC131263139 [Anopheles coustani]XP_058173114.1 uncharacterized protein LOC131288031 [Anopheles ziemanni]
MTDINRSTKQQNFQHKHNGQIDAQSEQFTPGLVLSSRGPNEHNNTANNGTGSTSRGGSLKRNNSHHQRTKKSQHANTIERGTNIGGHRNPDRSGGTADGHYHLHQGGTGGTRSGAGSGLAQSWSSQAQSTSAGGVGTPTQTPAGPDAGSTGRPPGSTSSGTKLISTIKTEETLGEDFKRFHTLRNSYGGKSNLNVNNTDQTIKTQVLLHQQKLREYSRQQQQQHVDNDSYSTCSSSQSDYQHPQHSQSHRHKHHTHHRQHHHQHHHQHTQQQHTQQQQPQPPQSTYPISATVAATATLTRSGGVGGGSILKNATNTIGHGEASAGVGGNRNSLRCGPGGLSTLSLCSCDAETEIIPNPLRPLYQYSLDRKNPRQHTYTCEQNAQILLRLEKDRQRKFGSMGKLHLATSTGDLSMAASATQRHPSITGASVPVSSVSTPTPTRSGNGPKGNTCKVAATVAANVLTFDCQHGPQSPRGGDNYAEDDSYSEDMIPPPPPPLNRRPSYGYGCGVVQQPVAPEPGHGEHRQPTMHELSSSLGNREGLIGNGSYQPAMNQPDLFNFTSSHDASRGGTLKSTLKSGKPLANSKGSSTVAGTGANANGKSKLNTEPLPVMMVDLMNGNVTGAPSGANGNDHDALGGEPTKPYPPYYFDDNYLHHHYYAGEPTELPLKDAMDGGHLYQLYQHHHGHHHPVEPVSGGGGMYIPRYEGLGGLPTKYNTIGANGHLPVGATDFPLGGHFTGLGSDGPFHHQGPGMGHHASTCNVNQTYQAGSAKSNLIASHHFSNSLSNFNFNPSQYFGSALDPPPGTTIIPGGLGGVMGAGDGFPSSCSLNGTPNKLQPAHPWKHRQCPSRGSSSTGSGSSKWDLPSRQWLAVTSILLIAGAAGVAVPFALKVSSSAPLEERLQVATQLLDTVPLIDGHNDLPWNIRKFLHNQLNDFRFDDDLKSISPWSKSAWSHTDLQRLKRGRISSQFWAAYVPCEAQHKDAVQITLEQIDVIKRLTERYSPQLTSCTSVYDIVQAHKNRQMCSLIGVEGGHSLGGSLGVLRIYYALGVRYMTLTSTCHTTWADSSSADAPKYDVRHGGLTAYGKTIIREMNRLGMIVDLSKSSVGTMKDVLATSQAPVIFSHSSAYALCNSSRNVQDEVLELVTRNRGLVMVNFYNKFLRCSENASVLDAAAHINHIRRVAGVDHVGLGAGYDGINFTPKDLEDVSSYPRLFAELLGDGWTIDELEKLAGRNLLRVFEDVEKVRDKQRLAGVRPYEDIPPVVRPEEHMNCTTNS